MPVARPNDASNQQVGAIHFSAIMTKNLLITGATGKQGGAVISSLLASPSAADFVIYAVTRNPLSSAASQLASKPNVKVIKGDLDDPSALFASAGVPIWSASLATATRAYRCRARRWLSTELSHSSLQSNSTCATQLLPKHPMNLCDPVNSLKVVSCTGAFTRFRFQWARVRLPSLNRSRASS